MTNEVTSNIEVSVKPAFLEHCSDIQNGQFHFSYTITITNKNQESIQLLSRHWKIMDSLSPTRYVNGEGVVGEQPIILPGESYSYQSYCELYSNLGFMEGSYIFTKESTQELVEVRIPRFELSLLSLKN